MLSRLLLGSALAVAASAQTTVSQVEFANLREDVRGLTQRVGELSLRVEQLERENAELRARAGTTEKSYVTIAQLNDTVTDLTHAIQSAGAATKSETLQLVAGELEKLRTKTNAALESLAKAQAARPLVPPAFPEDYPKEGLNYTVQKGDTLAVISKKTGAKQQDIINANKLADPSRIAIGQTLFIPGGK